MLLQLATLKYVARQVACGGGNTGNEALQFAKQQYCAGSCKEMFPVLLGVKDGQKQLARTSLTSMSNSDVNKTEQGIVFCVTIAKKMLNTLFKSNLLNFKGR